MTEHEAPSFTFGPFELRPRERRLLSGEKSIPLGAHAFDVLVALVERAGLLVTKDELLELVWPNLVVEENNVQVQVSALRKVLGAEAIVTVQGKGYRFALPTNRSVGDASAHLGKSNNNLPTQFTSFVGREKEIAEIRELLAESRLLTLTGAGGCGKTRIALTVAAGSLAEFSAGVWFVELAPIAEPRLVAQAVASALGVKGRAGTPILEAVVEYLEQKALLLLLDNCEHLLDACADVSDTIVRRCSNVTILASSREPLVTAGEQTYRVPSLTLPDREPQTLESLSKSESAQLFTARARLVRPDFHVSAKNVLALASICRRLDGIPLAIELAAARIRALSLEEIDSKLDRRFGLLSAKSRAGVAGVSRHETLRALIDWSYDLLNDAEKLLLQRLSVFAGGWTLGAAEEVCSGDDFPPSQVLDVLTALCDKSLVVVSQPDNRSRYGMLETIRQYASDRMREYGNDGVARSKHRIYFTVFATDSFARSPGETETALKRLDAEYENLRIALGSSLDDADAEHGLRICGALLNYWLTRELLSEGRAWCERFLKIEDGDEQSLLRAKVLNVLGVLAYYQSDFPSARAWSEHALAIARGSHDLRTIADALNCLALLADARGDFESAWRLYDECLAIMRDLKRQTGVARTLYSLAQIACATGDYAKARSFAENALATARATESAIWIASSLQVLGTIALGERDYAGVRALHMESLAIWERLGARGVGIVDSISDLGDLALLEGDYANALALHRKALRTGYESGAMLQTINSLDSLSAVFAMAGDPARAARLWGASERIRQEIGSPIKPNKRHSRDEWIARARAHLADNVAFDSAWQEGRTLRLEQAAELAFAQDGLQANSSN